MEFEELKEGNRLLDEIRFLRDSIFSIKEYIAKIPQKNEEPKNYIMRAKRTDKGSSYITLKKDRNAFTELVLYEIKDEDLAALRESLEKRLEESKKAFEAL